MNICTHADRRTLIPGLLIESGTSLGQPTYTEQRRVWLVIDSNQRPVGRDGLLRLSESNMFRNDYFPTKAEANAVALALHDAGCPLRHCEWDGHEPAAEKPKPAVVRYFGGWMGTP